MSKFKILVLFAFLIFASCGEEPLTEVKIYTFHKSSIKPREGFEVVIKEIRKHFFGMWRFYELSQKETDSTGMVLFQVQKGHYSIVVYKYDKLVFSTDEILVEDLKPKKV